MGQDVGLPSPSSFAQHDLGLSAGSGRTRKTRRISATSSTSRNAPADRSQSPIRKKTTSGSAGNGADDSEEDRPSQPPSPRGRPHTPEEADASESEASYGQEEDDDDADEEMMAALSQSRSIQRRRSTSISGSGALSRPSNASRSGGAPDSPSGSSSSDSGDVARGDGGDLDPKESERANQDQGMARAAGNVDFEADQEIPAEIDEDDDASLPRTTIPRSQWIPGFRQPRLFRASDVVPWSADIVSHLVITEIDIRMLSTP
ncbi:hypothetical protein PR003_g13990 [Phytophthora rubi]|uniref:Uncharacterized protein n=1 Tax=Phytophthora rubi TaxID=129364 RepID=A0A6A3LHG4_9STRA|nr:hypothetical protein PR002_g12997 [Phytophthora rubi]KAE9021731.1 hypothetical protein PR001_g13314 [Phytophthora rubi]KAE9333493.1 hypothetical protein PR003_g13990 [Phytophthora rubi]